jgi:hypothetical protein
MNYVSAVTCVKNEKQAYLEEWVRYHSYLGIEHFTFYNGGEPIAPLPHATIIDWPGAAQFNACIQDYYARNDSMWTALFDVDEFIVPHSWVSIAGMLRGFEGFGGLAISWLDFGSNGQPEDDRPQIEKFTRRSQQSFHLNKHVKTIAQLARTTGIIQSHSFNYRPGWFAVNTDMRRVDGPFAPNTISGVQMNHYYFRSKPEWERKVWSPGPCGGVRKEDDWKYESQCNEVEDLAALNIWKEIV